MERKTTKSSNIFSTGEEKIPASADLLADLERSLAGMYFISETDAALKPVWIKAGTSDETLETIYAAGLADRNERVEEIGFESLFSRLTRVSDGANDAGREYAERFGRLRDMLAANLDRLTVLRSGRIRIKIFVVGRDREGNVAGFQTEAVET